MKYFKGVVDNKLAMSILNEFFKNDIKRKEDIKCHNILLNIDFIGDITFVKISSSKINVQSEK